MLRCSAATRPCQACRIGGVNIGTFDSATTAYTGFVAHSATTTTVTATTTDAHAVVSIRPSDSDSDTDAHEVRLVGGPNTIVIIVESADGQVQQRYEVIVNRALQ